jgi:hypothetical protein
MIEVWLSDIDETTKNLQILKKLDIFFQEEFIPHLSSFNILKIEHKNSHFHFQYITRTEYKKSDVEQRSCGSNRESSQSDARR